MNVYLNGMHIGTASSTDSAIELARTISKQEMYLDIVRANICRWYGYFFQETSEQEA